MKSVKYAFTVHVSRSTMRNRSGHIHTPGWAWFRSGQKKPDAFFSHDPCPTRPSIIIPDLYLMHVLIDEKKTAPGGCETPGL